MDPLCPPAVGPELGNYEDPVKVGEPEMHCGLVF